MMKRVLIGLACLLIIGFAGKELLMKNQEAPKDLEVAPVGSLRNVVDAKGLLVSQAVQTLRGEKPENIGKIAGKTIYVATSPTVIEGVFFQEYPTEDNTEVTINSDGTKRNTPTKYDASYSAEEDGYYHFFLECFTPQSMAFDLKNVKLKDNVSGNEYKPDQASYRKREPQGSYDEHLIGFMLNYEDTKTESFNMTVTLKTEDGEVEKDITL